MENVIWFAFHLFPPTQHNTNAAGVSRVCRCGKNQQCCCFFVARPFYLLVMLILVFGVCLGIVCVCVFAKTQNGERVSVGACFIHFVLTSRHARVEFPNVSLSRRLFHFPAFRFTRPGAGVHPSAGYFRNKL